ncbi:MAG: hypothetical protein ACI4N3_03910 [Alphaproteobacteria bacterium]
MEFVMTEEMHHLLVMVKELVVVAVKKAMIEEVPVPLVGLRFIDYYNKNCNSL